MSHSETSPQKSILVLGSANIDLVVRVKTLPQPGETVLGGTFLQASGGKGANQAVAAARAGGQVRFVAAVGNDDYGKQAITGYLQEGIDCSAVGTIEETATGIATIMVDDRGQNIIAVASGANARLTPEHVNALPDAVLQSTDILLASLEVPLETVAQGLTRARRCGVWTILNPAPALAAAGDANILALVDVLTPNEGEAAQLVGLESLAANDRTRMQQAEAAAQELRRRGTRIVIVTLAELGCLVVADEVTPIKATNVTPVDATAAGDAFNGALAVALAEGLPIVEAARWANCAAGLAVTKPGAQPSLPIRSEIGAARG